VKTSSLTSVLETNRFWGGLPEIRNEDPLSLSVCYMSKAETADVIHMIMMLIIDWHLNMKFENCVNNFQILPTWLI